MSSCTSPEIGGSPGCPAPASVARQRFIASASWIVRRTDSMIRPIPCESELTIAIAPSSWSGPSAAIVAGWIRSRASSTSPGTPIEPPWFMTIIGMCSAGALTP